MVSNLAEAVFDVYGNVLLKHPKPAEIKGTISGIIDAFSEKELLTESDEIRAYHVAVAIYGFYVEGDEYSWMVLPELVTILDDKDRKYSKITIDDLCFFDPNLSSEKPNSYRAAQFKRKGLVCLLQGGFFYEHQQRPRAQPPETQIRWTGRNSFGKAAELAKNPDLKCTCTELSCNYEDYEKGFRRIKDVFYSNANS